MLVTLRHDDRLSFVCCSCALYLFRPVRIPAPSHPFMTEKQQIIDIHIGVKSSLANELTAELERLGGWSVPRSAL